MNSTRNIVGVFACSRKLVSMNVLSRRVSTSGPTGLGISLGVRKARTEGSCRLLICPGGTVRGGNIVVTGSLGRRIIGILRGNKGIL